MPHYTPAPRAPSIHPAAAIAPLSAAAALFLSACLNDFDCNADPHLPACCEDCNVRPDLPYCPLVCARESCSCTPGRPGGACQNDNDCSPDAPYCDQNVCIQCRTQTDCKDPAAAACDLGSCRGCMADPECAHFTDTQLCDADASRCVVCTASDQTACGANVCDPRTSTCTDRPAASQGLCADCLTSRECMGNMICVPTSFGGGDTGAQCFWLRDAPQSMGGPGGDCTRVAPYSNARTVTAVDGASASVCQLSATTCAALNEVGTTCAVDDDCGVTGVADGFCRNDTSSQLKCTVPCGGDQDCQSSSSCLVSSPRFCNLANTP